MGWRIVMNLTKVKGCYSKELRDSCYIIKMMVKEDSISVEEMIRVVKGIIEPAFIEAEAKKRFITNLEACNTKEEVDLLINVLKNSKNIWEEIL